MLPIVLLTLRDSAHPAWSTNDNSRWLAGDLSSDGGSAPGTLWRTASTRFYGGGQRGLAICRCCLFWAAIGRRAVCEKDVSRAGVGLIGYIAMNIIHVRLLCITGQTDADGKLLKPRTSCRGAITQTLASPHQMGCSVIIVGSGWRRPQPLIRSSCPTRFFAAAALCPLSRLAQPCGYRLYFCVAADQGHQRLHL